MATESFSYVRGWQKVLDAKGWWHSFELPDGRVIDGTNSLAILKARVAKYPIPEDLRGARVLDIGAWDGWFGFEMERRGADVVAVDCWDNPRFRQIHAALKSGAEYKIMDVYDLTPASVGRFDIVLFLGVLYHLKHPLLALERVCALTTNLAVVESFILQEKLRPGEQVPDRPVMEFYESEEFGGQTDNWCAPNLPCLMAMCRTAGFARVEHLTTFEHSACVICNRKWPPVVKPKGTAPELLEAWHHLNYGINFQTRTDDYVVAKFRAAGKFGIDDVRPEAGGYGVRPVHLSKEDDGPWVVKFKLPPGLDPGWHDVTLTAGKSPVSNAKRIAVDFPEAGPAAIEGASDGTTWERDVLNLSRGNVLSIWATGLPENADKVNVCVLVGGERVKVFYVEPPNGKPVRQINVHVPDNAPKGELELVVNGSAPFVVRIDCHD